MIYVSDEQNIIGTVTEIFHLLSLGRDHQQGAKRFIFEKKGAKTFLDKRGGETFFRQIFPKTRLRYLENFDRSLVSG